MASPRGLPRAGSKLGRFLQFGAGFAVLFLVLYKYDYIAMPGCDRCLETSATPLLNRGLKGTLAAGGDHAMSDLPHRGFRDAMFARAERAYEWNVARRNEAFGPRLVGDSVTKGKVFTYYAPLYPCFAKERVGYWGDGGKWICDPENLNAKSIVYSIGSYEQIDFELAMFKLTSAEIHVFDFSLKPDQQERMLKRTEFKYHNKGIGPATGGDFMSLPDMMKTLGHKYIDIFKIDCDGCEYSTFPALFQAYPDGLPIGQIQLEVHEYNGGNWNKVRDLIELIDSKGWRIFHYEMNWDCEQCIEIAFISEKAIAGLGPSVQSQ